MKKNLKKARLEISDYVISEQGQLCHKHLIAMELNTIYQSHRTTIDGWAVNIMTDGSNLMF